jgi:hypothetical protein
VVTAYGVWEVRYSEVETNLFGIVDAALESFVNLSIAIVVGWMLSFPNNLLNQGKKDVPVEKWIQILTAKFIER